MTTFKIIEDHGGSIQIESEINKGTTFLIQLPTLASGLQLENG